MIKVTNSRSVPDNNLLIRCNEDTAASFDQIVLKGLC